MCEEFLILQKLSKCSHDNESTTTQTHAKTKILEKKGSSAIFSSLVWMHRGPAAVWGHHFGGLENSWQWDCIGNGISRIIPRIFLWPRGPLSTLRRGKDYTSLPLSFSALCVPCYVKGGWRRLCEQERGHMSQFCICGCGDLRKRDMSSYILQVKHHWDKKCSENRSF